MGWNGAPTASQNTWILLDPKPRCLFWNYLPSLSIASFHSGWFKLGCLLAWLSLFQPVRLGSYSFSSWLPPALEKVMFKWRWRRRAPFLGFMAPEPWSRGSHIQLGVMSSTHLWENSFFPGRRLPLLATSGLCWRSEQYTHVMDNKEPSVLSPGFCLTQVEETQAYPPLSFTSDLQLLFYVLLEEGKHMPQHACGSQRTPLQSFSFHLYVGPKDWIWDVRFVWQALLPTEPSGQHLLYFWDNISLWSPGWPQTRFSLLSDETAIMPGLLDTFFFFFLNFILR